MSTLKTIRLIKVIVYPLAAIVQIVYVRQRGLAMVVAGILIALTLINLKYVLNEDDKDRR